MEQNIKFESGAFETVQFDEYAEDEFSIVTLNFLGTNPNSHQLYFSDEVFRRDIGTALGKWIVADLSSCVDCGTHDVKEQIIGRIPDNQEIQIFEQNGYLRAKCFGVISKIYSQNFCEMFEEDNNKSVSVEFRAITENNNPINDNVEQFNIVGITVLGNKYKPSSPGSDIKFIRFAEEEANEYFTKFQKNSLQRFAEERRKKMAKYKIDKSKESAVNTSWGDVDKTALRNKILEASNKSTLVKAVYLLVESGWEDAASEHLKYPVMQFKGDTLVYNLNAISSAQAYAEQHDETAVLSKIKTLRKKLGMDDSEKKEEMSKMEQVEFASLALDTIWCKIREALNERSGYKFYIEGIYEEDNQKFIIICDCDTDKMYRVNFDWSQEEGIQLATEKVEVEKEYAPSGEATKFAQCENVEQYKYFTQQENKEIDKTNEDSDKGVKQKESFEDKEGQKDEEKEPEESIDEAMAKLQKDIEDKDHIIMEQEAELAELRQFKANVENEKVSMFVNETLAQIKEFVDEAQYAKFAESAKDIKFDEMQGWKNNIMAQIGEQTVQFSAKEEASHFRMAICHEKINKTGTIQDAWNRLN